MNVGIPEEQDGVTRSDGETEDEEQDGFTWTGGERENEGWDSRRAGRVYLDW